MTATKNRKRKFAYDYYRINVPGDAFDTLEQACDCAIDIAREHARLYVMPCNWTTKIISGEIGGWEIIVRVCRIRNRPVS